MQQCDPACIVSVKHDGGRIILFTTNTTSLPWVVDNTTASPLSPLPPPTFYITCMY